MSGKELVGPLPTIYFHRGNRRRSCRVGYEVPKNTLDPRYVMCTEHHPACDCREAELAEQLHEYRADRNEFWRAAARLLVGHRLKDYGDLMLRSREEIGEVMWYRLLDGDGPLACQCTGCRIARAGHASIMTDDDGVVTSDAGRFIR